MATDYDAPRKADDDTESIEAIKERIPEKAPIGTGDDDVDSVEGFGISDVVDEDIAVVVLPEQEDEFTCTQCFIVKHVSMLASKKGQDKICRECAS